MIVRRSYVYRIYPNKTQTEKLTWTLDRCRELYNAGLEERREAWRMCGKSITYDTQQAQLPSIKNEVRPEYKQITAQVLQDVLRRLDRAFDAFFRRIKGGEKPGYPRFKGKRRYNSLTFTQNGWKVADKRLYIAGIGHIKVKWHRELQGDIKTVTVKRDADQWYVVFSCLVEVEPRPTADLPPVGIDMGLEYFATLSTGEHVENPRYYRKAQEAIARHDRAMRRRKRGGKNRAKAGILLKRAHRHVANQRKDMQHKLSRRIVEQHGAVVVEDLSIDNMSKRPKPIKNADGTYAPNGATAKAGLNKSINDAAWGQFIFILTYKAASAGTVLVKVNPHGTSQHCSRCGVKCPKTLDVRWHECAACGLSIQRDHNAACNILHRAGLARSAA